VSLDDPAETFHEASRLYPSVAPGRLETLVALAKSPALQQTTGRASRTHAHRPGVDLPRGGLPEAPFVTVLDARTSRAPEVARLRLRELAAVLGAGYAAKAPVAGASGRWVPSAGALYPLELYVLTLHVDDVERAVFHYDPFRHRLARLRPLEVDDVGGALVDPSLVDHAGALLVVTAMFWRSRFKYGLRGYRFALLEAGHVMQNATLAAAALGLAALPLGGFYDRRLDALVGADGLDEATVYALLLGAEA
jgi:SagB-type dehydrogenase family enzyme